MRIANAVIQRRYSREQERRADRFGVELVTAVYGQTEGMTRLFEILDGEVPAWAYMFETHPSPRARVADLRRYALQVSGASRDNTD